MVNPHPENPLKETLYNLGRQIEPQFVWEWFFKYCAHGSESFKTEPADMIENYKALLSMGIAFLQHKFGSGAYAKIIKDMNTPDWTYYYVGDTHGSMDDTYKMINYFIQVFQVRSNVKVIWIGDMVDRNPYDFQNLALILSFWILFPENVFIIRGNHEDTSVCSRYGFSNNIFAKVGSKELFNPVWDLVGKFFSMLPIGMISQVGDKRILVFHGGFPFDPENFKVWKLEEVEPLLNNFKAEYFDMDVLSQSILWADPDPTLPQGVLPNPRSGRPRFSEEAFLQFAKLNQIDCMIRGHSKWDNGYKLIFENRIISLFSTSTYDSQPIGTAKFLRIFPTTYIQEIEDEQKGIGKGILAVDAQFLQEQFYKYYLH